MSKEHTICGNTVTCGGTKVTCTREKNHPVVGIDNGRTRRFDFHRGEGWVWDDRCAWPEGQAPG